jgi:methanogenic corrinoid protein MtbC1
LDAARSGTSIKEIYLSVFQPVQYEIGRLWEENRISVALEHFATAVTQLIMAQLFPSLLSETKNGSRLVACCIGNELHELGMRMVTDFFEMDGWDTYFLGANTPNEAVLSSLEDHRAHCLAVSVTMTHHLKQAQRLVNELRQEPRLRNVKLLIGGYPFTQDESLHQDFAVDGWARDAQEATRVARKIMSG